MISIKGIDKALVLQALFNNSSQQGLGFLDRSGASKMSVEQATADIAARNGRLYFDYHRGRVMKCDISGDELCPRLYDHENGQGSAQRAIQSIQSAAA